MYCYYQQQAHYNGYYYGRDLCNGWFMLLSVIIQVHEHERGEEKHHDSPRIDYYMYDEKELGI